MTQNKRRVLLLLFRTERTERPTTLEFPVTSESHFLHKHTTVFCLTVVLSSILVPQICKVWER